LRALTKHSFKFSVVWQTTSASNTNEEWSVQLKGSHPAVKAYVARNKTNYPQKQWLDATEIFDGWLEKWEAGRFGKDHPQLPTVVGGAAAECYPSADESWDIWKNMRGE
jgi:hypothetical protein